MDRFDTGKSSLRDQLRKNLFFDGVPMVQALDKIPDGNAAKLFGI